MAYYMCLYSELLAAYLFKEFYCSVTACCIVPCDCKCERQLSFSPNNHSGVVEQLSGVQTLLCVRIFYSIPVVSTTAKA
jgi:hypothetical protein